MHVLRLMVCASLLAGCLGAGEIVTGGQDESATVRPAAYVPVRAPAVVGKASFFVGRGVLPVYLNRGGGAYAAGPDDASLNRSSVLAGMGRQDLAVDGWAGNDGSWDAVVACVRTRLEPWAVEIADGEPSGGAYLEIAFGGDGSALGMRGYGGAAPVDATGCRLIDRAVLFVFSDGLDAGQACDAAVQVIGHAASLDHAFLCEDSMSYLTGCGEKRFVDVEAPCGGWDQQACICGRATQNSARLLDQAIGRAGALPAPPGPACGATTWAGTCAGTVLSWCDQAGELRTLDCAPLGEECAAGTDVSDFDCRAAALPDACMGVDYYGQCAGNLLSYCYDGVLESIDCAAEGNTCGYQDAEVGYNCLLPAGDACMGIDYAGQCDGNVLSYCYSGALETIDCAAQGRVCAYESVDVGYNCL